MRDGDALPHPGRPEPLALQQRVEDLALRQAGQPRGGRGDLLQHLLLRLRVQRGKNGFGGQEIAQIHHSTLNNAGSTARTRRLNGP